MFWTAPMVASWLKLIGLGEYAPRFLENGVDGQTLLELRRDQFERCLGVTSPLHELSLRLGLQDLKAKVIDYTKWEWNSAGVMQWLASRGLDQLISRFQSAAVHGSVLFRLTKAEFASRLHVGELGESELVLESLWHAVERARKVGFYQDQTKFLDWGPVEIQVWLDGIDLGHLNDVFRDHAVNGTLLPQLDHNVLRRVMKLTEIQTLVLGKAIKRLLKPQKSKRGADSISSQKSLLSSPTSSISTSSSKSRKRGLESGKENENFSAQIPTAPLSPYVNQQEGLGLI